MTRGSTLAVALALIAIVIYAMPGVARACVFGDFDPEYDPLSDAGDRDDDVTLPRDIPQCVFFGPEEASAVAAALATVATNLSSIEQTPVSLPLLSAERSQQQGAIPDGVHFSGVFVDRICASGVAKMDDLIDLLPSRWVHVLGHHRRLCDHVFLYVPPCKLQLTLFFCTLSCPHAACCCPSPASCRSACSCSSIPSSVTHAHFISSPPQHALRVESLGHPNEQ